MAVTSTFDNIWMPEGEKDIMSLFVLVCTYIFNIESMMDYPSTFGAK